MPELPEVETVRAALEYAIVGATISKVTLRRADLRTPFPEGMAQRLTGAKIVAVRRRAKYLVFVLDTGWCVIAHLGMSGRFSVVAKAPKTFAAHDHVMWQLKDGRCVIYNDARRFGLMDMAPEAELEQHPAFAHLGPEPLEKGFSPAYLKKALEGRNAPIKVALMDQALVVGVGNIYASEALFLCGIDPRKPAASVAGKAASMVASIRQVLKDAIASGGSSLRDFVHVSGEEGHFQHRFNVYGKAGKPCPSCGTAIASARQAGRSTFFCPHCQR
ncbi:MAG: bifunctional DNA-formamidopyrimidine glycosylase/DNA-(apurinic or apyrimidinic site) lyase [Rickettsiales bacterium]|nr:bifunctional DNA-formamidopyrimidine glycosylase/DNA-(apurinic or apyrimidinic site) lyase [Rickettsiales bacterium]